LLIPLRELNGPPLIKISKFNISPVSEVIVRRREMLSGTGYWVSLAPLRRWNKLLERAA